MAEMVDVGVIVEMRVQQLSYPSAKLQAGFQPFCGYWQGAKGSEAGKGLPLSEGMA
jgi:hypothetical protein